MLHNCESILKLLSASFLKKDVLCLPSHWFWGSHAFGTWSICKLWIPSFHFYSSTLDLRSDEGFQSWHFGLILEDSKNLCVVILSWKPRKRGWPVLNALLLLLICGWCIMNGWRIAVLGFGEMLNFMQLVPPSPAGSGASCLSYPTGTEGNLEQ